MKDNVIKESRKKNRKVNFAFSIVDYFYKNSRYKIFYIHTWARAYNIVYKLIMKF